MLRGVVLIHHYDFSQVKLHGEPLDYSPKDLFIPPDALEIYLESFEGPLDVLLYLIRRQKLSVSDLPIVLITNQYLEYIQVLQKLNMNLAADYLVMAATLAEMKSRLLLPKLQTDVVDEDESREALIQKLLMYEDIQKKSYQLDQLPRLERDRFVARADLFSVEIESVLPKIYKQDLMHALSRVIKKVSPVPVLHLEPELFTLEDRMDAMMARLMDVSPQKFENFFGLHEGRSGVVLHFLALLELVKMKKINFIQSEDKETIYIHKVYDKEYENEK